MGCGSSQSVAVVNTDPMQPNNVIEQKIEKDFVERNSLRKSLQINQILKKRILKFSI